jgi:flotillin
MNALEPALLAQGTGPELPVLLLVVGALFVVLMLLLLLARRYKRCPSNRILVIYGRTKAGRPAITKHGGGKFVWPLIEDYEYLSLDPMQIEIPLAGALSIENIRVSVPSVFTVAIGTDEDTMNNAAIRLLGLDTKEIMKQAEDIIFGQLRQVIASMRIEEINRDRDVFLSKVQSSLEPELAKIGQVLINVNIKDITDESGYIEAIGRKAASEAIQQAEIDVAEQEKHGAIGVAEAAREKAVRVAGAEKVRDIGVSEAERDRAVSIASLTKEKEVGEQTAAFERQSQVKEAERIMRVSVADANAQAVSGENEAKAVVASSNATLRVKEAEAFQLGETRHREADAAVREAQYRAEAKAAMAQAEKNEAEKRAEVEAIAKAVKAQTIVEAEADAERRRIEAEGEAKAIYAKLEAEARGQYEILAKKGLGLKAIVESCGGADEAFKMLMLEHLDHLSETAARAISNVKFDKVMVWDSGDGANGNGGASGFLRGLAGALPPVMQMMRDIGGVEMPEYFGKLVQERAQGPQTPGSEGGPPPKKPDSKGGGSGPKAADGGSNGDAPKA